MRRDPRSRAVREAANEAQQWQWAETIIVTIDDQEEKDDAWLTLSLALAEAQQCEAAESIAHQR